MSLKLIAAMLLTDDDDDDVDVEISVSLVITLFAERLVKHPVYYINNVFFFIALELLTLWSLKISYECHM